MAVSTRALVDGFRAIVGEPHARDDRETRERAAIDGVVPRLVVAPASTDEVASVIAFAAAEWLAIVPRGRGTSLAQGVPAERVDLVLDLSRLDRILEYNADDLTVTVEAGVTGEQLAQTLAARGQFLAIDPPGVAGRTLGGLVATNASGPLRARYGTLRDLLLGVRFVQPDGVVTWGGSKVVKSVSGYDVPKLMVGALGTLGVVSELTLRLHARPEAERTIVAAVRDASVAQHLVVRVLDSSLQPNRLEMVDAAAMAALDAGVGFGVAVSFGSVDGAVVDAEADVVRLARDVGAVTVASMPALWTAYDRLWHRDADGTMLIVGTTPARLADTFAAVTEAQRSSGEPLALMTGGCAAVGSLRVLIPAVPPASVAGFVERLRAAIAAWDGTVVVQGAPREVRAAVDPWGPLPADSMALMRQIKATFDPERRLNPGRFVGGL